jgi:hypothetical protein
MLVAAAISKRHAIGIYLQREEKMEQQSPPPTFGFQNESIV